MALFFAVSLFASALLLFFVQPMVGKMVLPLMGGSPSVWNTCMVFFQGLLLAGYAYAHATTRRLGARRQARLHLAVMALPLVPMAILALVYGSPVAAVPALAPQGSDFPFFGVVALLAVTVGVPFFVVSTSAPLLTRWFADTDDPAAKDPYYLYAASNLGSLLALVLYPLAVEPNFRLSAQGWGWAAGYAVLVLLVAGCAKRLWTSREPAPVKGGAAVAATLVTPLTRLRWVALAFVPSSLMLSVTTYVTTDLSPIPLFWIVPLALYLLTFIAAFGQTPRWVYRANALLAPVMILMIVFLQSGNLKIPHHGASMAAHLLAFGMVALMCHGELARSRPAAEHLTEFFLWMSFGGVLGGLFNALVAPVAFVDQYEYPLALVVAGLLLPPDDAGEEDGLRKALDFAVPLGIFALAYGLLWAFNRDYQDDRWNPAKALVWLSDKFDAMSKSVSKGGFTISATALQTILTLGVPAVVCYMGVERPIRFGLGVLAIWLAGTLHADHQYTLTRERSFFGRVAVDKDWKYFDAGRFNFHQLTHGTTLHGKQLTDVTTESDAPEAIAEAARLTKFYRSEPLTYYHRTGPLGAVFRNFPGKAKSTEFAAIGLGTGSVAAYGEPGRPVTFYEIDAKVRRLAENPKFFTYVTDCRARGGTVDFEMGDARLMMAKNAKPGQYAAIVVDAFSSDAIPMHLLTLEAVKMYLDKLAEGGIICLHISNRYLDLEPVAARIAKELGLVALTQSDGDTYEPGGGDDNKLPGKQTSVWVMLARTKEDLDRLTNQPEKVDYDGRSVTLTQWDTANDKVPPPIWSNRKADDMQDAPLWTDDFSNLFEALTAFQKKKASDE